MSLKLHFFQHFDWDLTHQVLLLYVLPSHHMNLRGPALKIAIHWTDICNCKFSAEVSLMLDNPYPVPPICKLNHSSVRFIQISRKITWKQLISFKESCLFWSDPRCFGPLNKFQHNKEITTAQIVSTLCFRFLWLCLKQ